MKRKIAYFLIPFLFISLILSIFLLIPVQTAAAQCKDPSTCKTCHEVQGQYPVNTNGDWHTQHAVFDFCKVCHAGDPKAAEADAAHANMTLKLEEMGAACKNCHAADLKERYQKYASQLGVSDTPNLNGPSGGTSALSSVLGIKPADINPGGPSAPTTPASKPAAVRPKVTAGPNWGNIILTGILVLLVLTGGGFVLWNERRRLGIAVTPNVGQWIKAQIQRPQWSPYAAGVLLGLTGILSVWAGNHLLGASGAISTLTSTALDKIAPAAIQDKMYYQFIMPPGMSWEVVLLIGVFFGGMLGALSSGTFRLRWNDDPVWKKVIGGQPWKRFIIGFLGAVILQYGAGIAGGCTSGLAISGGMLLAPSAFLFMGGMFTTGILVAILVYRRKY